jgi:cytidine deaminase
MVAGSGRYINPIQSLMQKREIRISYDAYADSNELEAGDAILLQAAREAISSSYAPYSHFRVGAAGRMANGEILTGANQENASFPAGLCAEGVLLAAASSLFPGMAIETIAISYNGEGLQNGHPLAPCGVCRQSLSEYQDRFAKPIRLILSGMKGEVFILSSAKDILPLEFSGSELPK